MRSNEADKARSACRRMLDRPAETSAPDLLILVVSGSMQYTTKRRVLCSDKLHLHVVIYFLKAQQSLERD